LLSVPIFPSFSGVCTTNVGVESDSDILTDCAELSSLRGDVSVVLSPKADL
jgi:hypothetical protein